jgi:uncharacterized membrane protein
MDSGNNQRLGYSNLAGGGIDLKKYARCKVCGFVGREGEMKKVCPACGAPVTAFESYTYKISEERLKILDWHIHPILVHFPQSLAFLSLIFIVASWITQGVFSSDLMTVEKILSAILPVSVLAAMAAGMLDARTRFKKRYGPYIKQKFLLGVIFLLSSIITAVFIHQEAFTMLDKASVLILSLVSFICSGILGKKGGTLLDAKLTDQV